MKAAQRQVVDRRVIGWLRLGSEMREIVDRLVRVGDAWHIEASEGEVLETSECEVLADFGSGPGAATAALAYWQRLAQMPEEGPR